MATTRLMTIEDLEALPDDGHVYDLVDGDLRRREPVGGEHGTIGGNVFARVWFFVRERGLGEVLLSDTIYVYRRDPDRSLKPDLSFIRADRLPAGDPFRRPIEIPPDLAVEVVSPNERADDVDEKISLYRSFGVPLIWFLWPRRRVVTIYAEGRPMREMGEGDELDGGDVLHGFRVPVADLFRVGR
jgi:Uma2 family endonuclease